MGEEKVTRGVLMDPSDLEAMTPEQHLLSAVESLVRAHGEGVQKDDLDQIVARARSDVAGSLSLAFSRLRQRKGK